MARIKIEDLSEDREIGEEEMKVILGGLIPGRKHTWTCEIGGVEHTDTWSGEA